MVTEEYLNLSFIEKMETLAKNERYLIGPVYGISVEYDTNGVEEVYIYKHYSEVITRERTLEILSEHGVV